MLRSPLLMRLGRVALLCCAPALAADPGAAPPDAQPAATRLDTVVVTGQRLQDGPELELKIAQFLRTHAAKTLIDQYARWREPVCPQALGLPAAQASLIVARILEVAGSVAAPLEQPCATNITIAFSAEPQQLLDAWALRHRWVLGPHALTDTARVARLRHPIQAWYATATRGGGGAGRPQRDDPYQRLPSGGEASRLTNGLASELGHVLVVVDAAKLEGRLLAPVADYIAMLVLSQPGSLTGCGELPSIIDLLSATCREAEKPQALAAADLAYLRALYRIDLRAIGSIQKSQLFAHMRQELLR